MGRSRSRRSLALFGVAAVAAVALAAAAAGQVTVSRKPERVRHVDVRLRGYRPDVAGVRHR